MYRLVMTSTAVRTVVCTRVRTDNSYDRYRGTYRLVTTSTAVRTAVCTRVRTDKLWSNFSQLISLASLSLASLTNASDQFQAKVGAALGIRVLYGLVKQCFNVEGWFWINTMSRAMISPRKIPPITDLMKEWTRKRTADRYKFGTLNTTLFFTSVTG
jgi:hypothetical protein